MEGLSNWGSLNGSLKGSNKGSLGLGLKGSLDLVTRIVGMVTVLVMTCNSNKATRIP